MCNVDESGGSRGANRALRAQLYSNRPIYSAQAMICRRIGALRGALTHVLRQSIAMYESHSRGLLEQRGNGVFGLPEHQNRLAFGGLAIKRHFSILGRDASNHDRLYTSLVIVYATRNPALSETWSSATSSPCARKFDSTDRSADDCPHSKRGQRYSKLPAICFHFRMAPSIKTIPPNLAGRSVPDRSYKFVMVQFFPNILIWRIAIA